MAEIRVVNLTPHNIVVLSERDGGVHETVFEPSGTVARVRADYEDVGELLPGVPLVRRVWGDIEGLPDPQPGVYYIVSGLVRSALDDAGEVRPDVLVPDTGPTAVRDDEGRIRAVRRLITPV